MEVFLTTIIFFNDIFRSYVTAIRVAFIAVCFIMIIYFLFLSIIRIFCFSTLVFYLLNFGFSLDTLSFGGNFWRLLLSIDRITMCVLLMLIICFLYVLKYTNHYFGGDVAGIDLNKIICLFVTVMASLVCTGDYLSTLIFWEYLGVVRFFLILFYDRYLSLRSSIITLVSSRFGDVCLFIIICMRCYQRNRVFMALILFLLIIFTKSASFPFTSWLLEAMRAPTPVSSLVHSSTLVAAGVWFAMRYDFVMYFRNSYIYSMLLLLTIFITGVCCFFFIDLKKIVALSTCKNIAWCVFYLIFGDWLLSLFQLISHGVSKCILFIHTGDVMRGSGGSQNRNCVYGPRLYKRWGIFSLFSIILGLSGAPYIGVFFTKHFLLTNFMKVRRFTLYFVVLLCVFLSYFYSFRLCVILTNLNARIVSGVLYSFNTSLMVYFWLSIKYFISFILDENVSLKKFTSINLIGFQIICCFTALAFYKSNILSKWRSSLFGCDKIVEGMYTFYYNILILINLFFYRWDNYTLSLFRKVGSAKMRVYLIKFLKIVVITIFLFLACFIILY